MKNFWNKSIIWKTYNKMMNLKDLHEKLLPHESIINFFPKEESTIKLLQKIRLCLFKEEIKCYNPKAPYWKNLKSHIILIKSMISLIHLPTMNMKTEIKNHKVRSLSQNFSLMKEVAIKFDELFKLIQNSIINFVKSIIKKRIIRNLNLILNWLSVPVIGDSLVTFLLNYIWIDNCTWISIYFTLSLWLFAIWTTPFFYRLFFNFFIFGISNYFNIRLINNMSIPFGIWIWSRNRNLSQNR